MLLFLNIINVTMFVSIAIKEWDVPISYFLIL